MVDADQALALLRQVQDSLRPHVVDLDGLLYRVIEVDAGRTVDDDLDIVD